MRCLRPSNWGQYVARPIPNTPTRARCPGRGSAAADGRVMSEAVIPRFLEIELVDVVLVEGRQRSEHDLTVGADRVLAETPRLELLALLAGDAAGHKRRRGLAGEVAHVLRHP